MKAPETSRGVTFSLRLVAPDDGRDEVVKTFRSVLGPIRGSAGCLRCSLLEDVQQSNQLQLSVDWKRQEDFERHVKSDVFRRVLQATELAAELPELQIRTVTGVRGMGLLREILGCEEDRPPPCE